MNTINYKNKIKIRSFRLSLSLAISKVLLSILVTSSMASASRCNLFALRRIAVVASLFLSYSNSSSFSFFAIYQ